jgi:hypothetical protein
MPATSLFLLLDSAFVAQGNLLNEFRERNQSYIYIYIYMCVCVRYILILIAPEGTWTKFSLSEKEALKSNEDVSFFVR